MKRIISLFMILATLSLLICSCSLLPEEIRLCKVRFYVDGELYDTKTVTFGQTVKMPQSPTKTNEIFVGWCIDGIYGEQYDFGKKVTDDLDLHANFTIDAVSMTNMVRNQIIRSIVTVENKCYNSVGNDDISTDYEISQGSGVIVDISGGYCYVLTNCHVVEKVNKYAKQKFTVEDPWGNEYEAQIYKNAQKTDYAVSEDYDLALLYFRYIDSDENNLEEIVFGSDPAKNDYVATIGTPGGLQNAISYGRVLEYQQIKVGNDTSLKQIMFEVIIHNAPLNHGSSGGALINMSGQLVGINFAGYSSGDYGCTIPISKVMEFMNIFVY